MTSSYLNNYKIELNKYKILTDEEPIFNRMKRTHNNGLNNLELPRTRQSHE